MIEINASYKNPSINPKSYLLGTLDHRLQEGVAEFREHFLKRRSAFTLIRRVLCPSYKPCRSRIRGDHKNLVNSLKDIKPQLYKHCPGQWTWENNCHAKDRQQDR